MREIFLAFLRLGLVSFGGPTAHIGYFHSEFVIKKKWIEESVFAEMQAICQMLPGPASSQLGICIGAIRGGTGGGLAAWLGFTLPSAVLLVLFAELVKKDIIPELGWIQGWKLVAAAVIAHAVFSMGKTIIEGSVSAGIVVFSLIASLIFRDLPQIVCILLAGVLGSLFLRPEEQKGYEKKLFSKNRKRAWILIVSFFLLLGILPILRIWIGGRFLEIADGFYRTGALVFGGGHVVLPLLEKEFVSPGFLDHDIFLMGYGAAQAVPGPLFTFSAYIGVFLDGIGGAVVGLVLIFLPSFLILFGVLPYWEKIREYPWISSAVKGMNASVLGILAAALYDPVLKTSVHSWLDLGFAVLLFLGLLFFRIPNWFLLLPGFLYGLFRGAGYL
ncbi:chromate efflux transporter [Leptospira wolffii]|uniref:chromate efflux transporter n=1 Tax=Leptospira wolffii TaxID=409998 RepID=UPI0010828B0C|nr:chromate efflux transporter [Leptospira wolffii]TGK58312.1 chromate efflux transporter [Leptospira wolffii]TGK66311.1 chromate efflux transporter [Leptospira wolffii]TGK68990.1 chromate efflux transporter [Leptospira wolffii]TGL27342.1 chromate efflux transporter [Leptospira wolffii]